MRHKSTGEYPENWDEISFRIKQKNNWKCERCGHKHELETNHILTVHHLDGDKSNNEEWNLAALCQRCHLQIQGKIFLPQFYMFEHSLWFKSHVAGYYESEAKKAIERYHKIRELNPIELSEGDKEFVTLRDQMRQEIIDKFRIPNSYLGG